MSFTNSKVYKNSTERVGIDDGTISLSSIGNRDCIITTDNAARKVILRTKTSTNATSVEIQSSAGTAYFTIDGSGAVSSAFTTYNIDATGAVTIDSSAGAISIGADAVAQAVNIATGAAARVITIGNAASASCAIDAGVGAFSAQADTTVTLTSGTSMTFAPTTTLSLSAGGAAANIVQAPHIILGEATNGAVVHQGYTVDTVGGAQTISAAELCNGYYYKGAAGGGVALTLPGAAAVQTYLATRGITSAAGMCLPDILIDVSDANALTVTAGAGETVLGSPAVNNVGAVAKYIFTGAATADCIVVLSS